MADVEKDRAIVEIRSGKLMAFDLPYEGVSYDVPDFSPGLYCVPLSAIRQAPQELGESEQIFVDTGIIFLVDAEARNRLSEIEQRLWVATGDSYEIINRHNEAAEELGLRFDFFSAPGRDSGYEFEGDGAYMLDMSQVTRVRDSAE